MPRTQNVFAEGTTVPVTKTMADIDAMIAKYKASHFAVIREPGFASVAFRMNDRHIRFKISIPDPAQPRAEQVSKERWRALLLSIKAKLVSVDSRIESFEEAFLAHVVMPSGRTVWEETREQIKISYDKGSSIPLLEHGHGG